VKLCLLPNCNKTHHFPNFSYFSSEIRVSSSWNFMSFRHLILESQSNNAVLTSVGCISDGLQVMVLSKVRSSRARLFLLSNWFPSRFLCYRTETDGCVSPLLRSGREVPPCLVRKYQYFGRQIFSHLHWRSRIIIIDLEDGSSIFYYVDIYLLTIQQPIPQKGDVYSNRQEKLKYIFLFIFLVYITSSKMSHFLTERNAVNT